MGWCQSQPLDRQQESQHTLKYTVAHSGRGEDKGLFQLLRKCNIYDDDDYFLTFDFGADVIQTKVQNDTEFHTTQLTAGKIRFGQSTAWEPHAACLTFMNMK